MIDRIIQAWRYAFQRPPQGDLDWAGSLLPPELAGKFSRMGAPDKAHATRVARRLEALGAPPELLAAALLHDAAKPAWYGLFWRSAMVLLPGEPPPPEPPARARWARARQVYHWHEAYIAQELDRFPGIQAYLHGKGEPNWQAALRSADQAG